MKGLLGRQILQVDNWTSRTSWQVTQVKFDRLYVVSELTSLSFLPSFFGNNVRKIKTKFNLSISRVADLEIGHNSSVWNLLRLI